MSETKTEREPTIDELYASWQKHLSDWPIGKTEFEKRINQTGSRNLSPNNTESKDLISIVVNPRTEVAQITALVTDEEGISNGTAQELLNKALQHCEQAGVKEIKLCSGAGNYFWPGIPTNLPHIKSFFEKNGFNFYETSVDMTQNLSGYKTPDGLVERAARSGFEVRNCTKSDLEAVLRFEQKHFPKWHKYFQEVNNPSDIFIALQANKVVGTCLALPPYATGLGETFLWKELLGNKVGGVGSVGVVESTRGKGVGSALSAKATEHIKSKGAEIGFLGWTWLVDWYGQLGYKVWREYSMGSKKV